MNDNLIQFFKQRNEVFPIRRDVDLQRFLADAVERPSESLPIPAKIFLADEIHPHSYGFPLSKAPALDELETRLSRWCADELVVRTQGGGAPARQRAEESLVAYRTYVLKLAKNALSSSILSDYHAIFWLAHSQQLARVFTTLPKKAVQDAPNLSRESADQAKYAIWQRYSAAMREAIEELASEGGESAVRFPRLLLENGIIATEDFISSDLRELRTYFSGALRRDFSGLRKWFDDLTARAHELMQSDRLFRRAIVQLGYPETPPTFVPLLDRRVQELIAAHPGYKAGPDQPVYDSLSKKLLEYFVVYHLRRGITWMKTTPEGENVADDGASTTVYSRAIRPMNFGRRGVVEPIVYRYGLVYDITSFTQTLGEIARGGKDEEQASYRQMLDFQRDLADIAKRHGLTFEKFLGDGAFYTSRRATRTLQASLEVQRFYSTARERGFAFNKGMRIALNYGYYRLLPMQVSHDGTQIMEFYGPGIVELSRLTTGKTTKEIEDIQHLLLSHGYDQHEVYRFFAPLSRATRNESTGAEREFFAYVNENGHLINEGIVASIPFLQQFSTELTEDQQVIYRMRTPFGIYLGVAAAAGGYVGIRLIGSVSLKGIGNQEVAEVVRLTPDEAEVSIVEEAKPLIQLLRQERNRSTARSVGTTEGDQDSATYGDLVVCESHLQSGGVILVGEWDPVSEEVRRPIRLAEDEAERFGLEIPITAETVESQTVAYQKLYQKLSRIATLPSFSIQAIKDNANFNGYIIGETVERL
ncbi:MAG TPA: hypothetical protein VF618_08690 [Thermoanaerobaculia bacterium]